MQGNSMFDKRTLIIIVSYNACHLMQECIRSIRNTVEVGTYRIVVVDNASTDGVTQWLDEQDDIFLIKNNTNVGFGPACNQAVKATLGTQYEGYDVFLLNNDTRLTDKALYFLKEALYSSDSIGAAGCVSNYAGNRQQVDVIYDRVEDYIKYAKQNNVAATDVLEERVRLSGFAMLIKREAWNKTGGFDEDFAPGYFEDDALSMELLKNGYRLVIVKNSFIYHAGSQSFAKTDYNTLLEKHRSLFEQKYGFDIIDNAYADEAALLSIPFAKNDRFRLLQIGCGIGAELKLINSVFRNSETVGIEFDKVLYDILRVLHNAFNTIEDVAQEYGKEYFDVLLMDDRIMDAMCMSDRELLVSTCKTDAILIIKRHEYEFFRYDKIRLIIWDLDDTLWRGTLSETDVVIPDDRIKLIHMLADHGIVNSISSKNDEESVKSKLTEAGIWDLFVFNSVNWEEKGSQISEKINRMGLRTENVLFIDDNPRNLKEAEFDNDSLMTAGPDIIPYLEAYYRRLTPLDLKHSRLEHYKLLERKTNARKTGISREEFLHGSDIQITINRNCFEELDRIHEMVMRTNQLNYTKNRDNKSLLEKLITNDWNDCAYIRVRDRFGDYGIVGFYCYNVHEKVMEHFLFSCRVLGMGIEQYIYNKLGCPKFDIKKPVAAELKTDTPVTWVNEVVDEEIIDDKISKSRVRVLLKGPCDMSAIEPYLAGANITTEFSYVNDRGFVTTGHNHSVLIRESAELSTDDIESIISEVPFIIKGDFETKLFDQNYHVICFSLLADLCAGLYKNRNSGAYISFGSRNHNLTDEKEKFRFINKEIQNHNFEFTEKIISDFSANWEFVGSTSIEMLLDNLDYIYENVKGKPLMILLLGSEIDYNGYNEEFDGMAAVYREINPVIEAFAEDHERIKVINPSKYIHSQDDFEDCINHFSRNVYYEIAGEICNCINEYI